jgi:hypothetical protein
VREIDVGEAALSEGKGLELAFGVPVLYVEVRWIPEDSRAEFRRCRNIHLTMREINRSRSSLALTEVAEEGGPGK